MRLIKITFLLLIVSVFLILSCQRVGDIFTMDSQGMFVPGQQARMK